MPTEAMVPDLPIPMLVGGFMIYARLTGLFLTLPGFVAMPSIARQALAIPLTLVLLPVVSHLKIPETVPFLLLGVASEVFIGLTMGTITSILVNALTVAGEIISINIGLGMAAMLDPLTKARSDSLSTLCSTFGVGMFLVTDTHLRCLEIFGSSLQTLPPGSFLSPSVAAPLMMEACMTSVRVGAELSGPVVLFALLTHLALSILGRMAPNLNIFFSIGMSLNMSSGFMVLLIALPATLFAYLPNLDTALIQLHRLIGD
jgi:flagellar biosynthetic protein FliR